MTMNNEQLAMKEKSSILVVDDEPNGFTVIEAHLYREGYELTYAPSGIEALNLIDTVEPDVILLDVMMPDMDGMEVCRKLKSDPKWQHVPIIMVTALNSKEDLARSLDAGADDFLTKPISGLELRARVRSMLRIKQQYDALQETLTLREDLSNMIVHDLRNPLTKITVSASLLAEGNLDEDDRQTLQFIVSAGRQLNTMIDDLLMQAKMQAGKMVLNRSWHNLNKLAGNALTEFQSIAVSKNIQVESNIPELGYLVSVDANLIRRVIDNLLSNAYKFSYKNSTITLELEYIEPIEEAETLENKGIKEDESFSFMPKAKNVAIRIIDRGMGVDDEKKQHIFGKYEVGKPVSGVSQIGLGLAFCKMVVEAHDGKIFVEDNHPKGAIFTVVV